MKPTPTRIVDAMYEKDAFSQWLGIERVEDGEGSSILKMRIRPEMLNGFGIVHGGIIYSFADSAFAFASNSQGRHAVSIETSMSQMKSLPAGTVITALAKQIHLAYKIGIYEVKILDEAEETVAFFKGTVYRKSQDWEV